MRKRKKPIVLITIFGVLVVAVIGFNAYAYNTAGPSDGHAHGAEEAGAHEEEEKPVLTQGRTPTDGKSVATEAAAKMGGPTAAPSEGPKGGPGRNGPKTSLLRTTPAAMKPKPNDSATSQQWWTDESNAKSGGN